jgi:hypothetical protein
MITPGFKSLPYTMFVPNDMVLYLKLGNGSSSLSVFKVFLIYSCSIVHTSECFNPLFKKQA